MKSQLKRTFHSLLANTWFRQGSQRQVLLGPYRGLTFYLSPPMRSRLSLFYRAYEADVSGWLADHLRPGMMVLIPGGHVGIHVLYAAKLLSGQGCVYAFEGWPENFEALKTNIALNPRLSDNVQPVFACVSDQSGSVTMTQGSSDGKHHVSAEEDDAAITHTVPAITLDDFAAERQIAPDLILMDIEGHELAALRGAQYVIKQYKPALLLEHHGQQAALKSWLEARAYRVTDLGKRHIVAE